MNETRVSNIIKNGKIVTVLLNFKEDKTGKLNDRKYRCAKRLTVYQKNELEAAKADLEFYIDKMRTAAAFIALFGVIVSNGISIVTDILNPYIELIVIVFAALGSFLYLLAIAPFLDWLHILKIAIAQKSKDSESMTVFKEWNDPEEDIYNAKS
ncbi:hypothetical protein HC931_09995 [Candidatus Gracilibacteria bacterium]|nr:hypothetical protein [Candidatus Gracilibacteria bacterium]NJM89489.1 hypothetical protein [Hydrococcus sp. RU_2_2]NJP20880.1 hypothetical protein [Hydrococcus sp. CRU_1_1]